MPKDLKEKVKRTVSEKGLCSCMNDTKWNELRSAMLEEMPFPPPYIVKFVIDDECFEEKDFQQDVYHTCDWYYAYSLDGCFNAAFAVEWIKVRPRYLKNKGQLIPPETVSAEEEFRSILEKYSIPFEEQGGVYCIYGYK